MSESKLIYDDGEIKLMGAPTPEMIARAAKVMQREDARRVHSGWKIIASQRDEWFRCEATRVLNAALGLPDAARAERAKNV
jgi:hypothetical protein